MLRQHQIACLAALDTCLSRHTSALVVAATGTGKTTCIAEQVSRWVNQGARVLVLAHTWEIVKQLRDRLEEWGLLVGVECGERKSTGEPVVVASIQSLRTGSKRLARVQRPFPFTHVVIDEAHHAAAATYRQLLLVDLPPHIRVGFTATPLRGDKRPLREVFATVAHHYGRDQATRDGHLVPHRETSVESASGLAHVIGSRRTVAYTRTKVDSKKLVADLCLLGIRAEHADGDMTSQERAGVLARFANGHIQVLSNAALVTEGWDVPGVECVAVMRGVGTAGPLAQMLGRGLRAAPGKRECLLVRLPGQIPLDDPAPQGTMALGQFVNLRRSPNKQQCPRRAPESPKPQPMPRPATPKPQPSFGRRLLGWLGL